MPLRRRGKEKRTLVILLLMAVVVGGVVCYVIFRKVPRIMPPEAAEIQAQRQAVQEWLDARSEQENRPSLPAKNSIPATVHENAYLTLCEATELLPVRSKITRSFLRKYLMGFASGVWPAPFQADDDPRLISYIENCGGTVEKARQAFDADYFRFPERDYDYEANIDAAHLTYSQHASGLFLSRNKGQHVEGLRCLLDALETMAIIESDSVYPWTYLHRSILESVHEVATQVESVRALRDALARFESMKMWERPRSAKLERLWRDLELIPLEDYAKQLKLSHRETVLNNFVTNWGGKDFYRKTRATQKLRSRKRAIQKNRQNLLKAVDLSFSDLRQEPALLPDGFRKSLFARPSVIPAQEVLGIQEMCAEKGLLLRAMRIFLALEVYQREHGQYPVQLEDMVPLCFAKLPLNPYLEKPFDYERIGSDYRLSAKRVSVYDYRHGSAPVESDPMHSEYTLHEPDPED